MMIANTCGAFVARRLPARTLLCRNVASSEGVGLKRVVFLGTPHVAAQVLEILHAASVDKHKDLFQIVGVVVQPPAVGGRTSSKRLVAHVADLAEKLQLPLHSPESAKDESFLTTMEDLKVDLFVTAAYGNYLPKRFLKIAPFGTINIHPSLLPKYRGAAPVQRCLENGDAKTGVSLLYSVMKMDAGPVLKQLDYELTGNEKGSEVLRDCFDIGAKALVDLLPGIFDGTAKAVEQDDSQQTHAAKLETSDGSIDFSTMTARVIHNKCRAFLDWPGVFTWFRLGGGEPIRFKIITTRVVSDTATGTSSDSPGSVRKAKFQGQDILEMVCSDGSILGVLELQMHAKKVVDARSFINGLRGKVDMVWEKSPPLPKPRDNDQQVQ